MRNAGFTWFLLGLMVLLDIYVFQAIKVIAPASPRARIIITTVYWLLSVASIAMIMMLPYSNSAAWPKWIRTYVFAIVIGLFMSKLLASLFIAVDDIRRAGTWAIGKFTGKAAAPAEAGISRSVFLSWLSLAVGGGLFGTLLYGFNNKYRYQVNKLRLSFANLPAAFKGMKIVHISDIHSGSFTDKEAVEKGIRKIMDQKPDLILFTGDLVNDRAVEMEEYKHVFAKLKAPMGVYSTLGNHDYGDYVHWESADVKAANLESLKSVHGEMGWRLLMNEHVVLEKEGEQIALLGIENWSARGNFPKYGKMHEAHTGSEKYPFKILMSHDPSHWEAEVLDKYKDVDLMLAGHTHGMQFGLEVPGFKWSPVQYMYKQWAGLYEAEQQRLYVNRGFGFIGYPGRVGIMPEITVLELA
ncbi:metallophosphoesterase [Paraflavitalea sp. CAU 1676]|uniref:metallophosphoesterase n=1 Tax=Paraflavitalea sp. CAU 1676 TaxID=3032598 RepID=UPI0023D9EA61|nr:metallophosphoesterase [Paraflavitalea sp. CAU 1676]MDF2189506.1 metallophosphoesterase [Paraflavitalea sp. CAU 1676]